MAAVFANTAYMGIPLFLTAFGPERTLPAIVATIAVNTLVIGGVSVTLEYQRAGAFAPVRTLARVLLRNPLLVAPLLAIPAACTVTCAGALCPDA